MGRNVELVPGHSVVLLQGAQELFPALVRAMDGAAQSVRFETYICDFTDSGASIGEALERAARRGVQVQLLVDGFGTGGLATEWLERLRAAGVQYQVYAPLGPLGLLLPERWRRLHRKLCVVDGGLLFCGGINLLDDFHDPNHGRLEAPRLDFAVQVRGPIAAEASAAMQTVWWRMQAASAARSSHLVQARRALQAAQSAAGGVQGARPGAGTVRAALLLRDNLLNRTSIERAYLRAIAQARLEIIIANAYFVPGRRLRRALVLAARRGVRVRLLLQGRYEYFLQYHAARPVYGSLLRAGVEIHEYAPSFLHAKVAVIDAEGTHPWATVGSSNLDPLSLLLAKEANVAVADADFAHHLRERLVHAMEHAGERIDSATYAARPWRERLLDRLAFALVRTALWLTGKTY
ncbi:MAG: cardiolipin synthase ClsB [Burkholderiaceae bacterium]|jgi:cardiolipin synthase|nr:cardiolipin synthase ClsB [Burkholderiaceae bacterium]